MVNFKKEKKNDFNKQLNPDDYDFEDLEVLETENYKGDKEHLFNHQALIMEVLRRVYDAGCHELRPGWFNESIDNRGSLKRSYVEDTRKRFVESVKTAVMYMKCDFDPEAVKKIDILLKDLKTEHEKLLNEQWCWFTSLPPHFINKYEGKIIKGFFNIEMGWYLKYIELEVECYRSICEELNLLTKRINFYQAESFQSGKHL